MRFLLKKLFVHLLLVTAGCYANQVHHEKGDIVIFSYDRPLQLYALLESLYTYVEHINTITIIYRASNDAFDEAYRTVKKDFPPITMFKQGHNPYHDFKPLTVQAITNSSSAYVMFAVDDNIVKDTVDLHECIAMLEKTGAYGFYLRLGKNLTYCLPYRCHQSLPPFIQMTETIYGWHFNRGTYDWAYPHTVDMAVYRKRDVLYNLTRLSFTYPNTLECGWNGYAGTYMHRMGLCYAMSKIVNIPLNRVQPDFHSQSMEISPEMLLHIFNDGKKIDIGPLKLLNNNSAHYEYIPSYRERNGK